MEKSKASWQLRQALKRRTRKWRRRQVVLFYVFMLLVISVQLGTDHHGWQRLWFALYTIVGFWGVGAQWFRQQRRIVASLDDRAQAAYGLNFDQLGEAEQKEIMRRKLLLLHVVLDSEWSSDERQQAFRLHTKDIAYRILKTALPWFVAAYWALYLIVPAGYATHALMDAPIVVSWLAVFVVTLPTIVEMWKEPDEVGEARVV